MALITLQTPSEKFQRTVRILRTLASICGIDLLRKNYRMNWITYSLLVAIAGYFVFVFWTIYQIYPDDWTIILKASVTIGSALQGVSKLLVFISNQPTIEDLYDLLSKVYRDYEKRGDRYFKALDKSAEKTKQGLIYYSLFYSIGVAGVVTVPHLWLLFTGEHFLVMEFHLPGLDIHTDFGYYATLVVQSIMVISFGFGLYCGDLVAIIYLLQSFMFSYVFAAKIECLNDMIEDPDNSKKPCVTKALNDIAEWVQLYSSYTTRCNNLFYYVITVQILSASGSIVISIYLVIAGGWPGAYPYIIISTCCLYVYCILGTETESANDKFEADVYCTNWYNLTVPQQKIVLQLLVITQTPKTIDIAGIMPLTVSTALQITKSIYSLTMFMIQFLME